MDFIYGTAIYIYIYISFDFRIFVYPFTFLITGTRNYFETEKRGGGKLFSHRECAKGRHHRRSRIGFFAHSNLLRSLSRRTQDRADIGEISRRVCCHRKERGRSI